MIYEFISALGTLFYVFCILLVTAFIMAIMWDPICKIQDKYKHQRDLDIDLF